MKTFAAKEKKKNDIQCLLIQWLEWRDQNGNLHIFIWRAHFNDMKCVFLFCKCQHCNRHFHLFLIFFSRRTQNICLSLSLILAKSTFEWHQFQHQNKWMDWTVFYTCVRTRGRKICLCYFVDIMRQACSVCYVLDEKWSGVGLVRHFSFFLWYDSIPYIPYALMVFTSLSQNGK